MDHLNLLQENQKISWEHPLTSQKEFLLNKVKSQRRIEPKIFQTLCGWKGHRIQQKWLEVQKGSFLVLIVQPDNWKNPSYNLPVQEFIIQQGDPLFHIPNDYAYGFKAIEEDSKMLELSDVEIEKAIQDEYTFNRELWYYESFM